ncbi:MAG: D-alanyl-D-alanine carboxypeptidase [Alphaproteobacteria bacterium]|nr:D-alanyl-D-alanine carboxypeptidase [Alphaproteobacteria bacterium]
MNRQTLLSAPILFFLCLTVVFVGFFSPVAVSAADNPRYASLVMDADTGIILHQRYADKKVHPASLTKVMTLMLVFDALERGTITLDERVKISKHAAGMPPSKLGLPAGSSLRVQDAIYALVTKSANDIAAALAEHVGGTEPMFARMMTRRAHALGMSKTLFTNASGLHNPAQTTTARDMVLLARAIIQEYPEYYRYFSTKNFTYAGHSYHNHNRLMESYPGMDGMKTGYVNASGFNLVASAVRGNRRLIGVVFGGRTTKSRNDHMASLLDQGFANIENTRIAQANIPLPGKKPFEAPSPAEGSMEWANMQPAAGTAEDGGEVLGQGDYDPALDRISPPESTQMISAQPVLLASLQKSAPRHRADSVASVPVSYSASPPSSYPSAPSASPVMRDSRPGAWSIQVGAFESRVATDRAVHENLRKLPQHLAYASPVIAPLKTEKGWLFRARLEGFSRADAYAACGHLESCLPVAPRVQ